MEIDVEALQMLEEPEPESGLFPCPMTCKTSFA
ncbi:ALQxL family class IV lanthipeptide [Actinoplanes sp. NPDC049681]